MGQGFVVMLRRIELHFNNSLDISGCRNKTSSLNTQSPGYRRTNLINVQNLTLNL